MNKTILSIVLALTTSAVFAGDLDKKGELQANFGYGRSTSESDNAHFGVWGANLGWGIAKQVTLFGEFNHGRLDKDHSDRGVQNIYDYDGGAKVSLWKSDKVEPYALVAFGGAHFPHGDYVKGVHLGVGSRIYVGGKSKKWGIAPEFRWVRYMDGGDHINTIRITGGLFMQWGK